MKRISFTALGVVLAILVGAMLLFIFMNSEETADESSESSRGVTRFILSIVIPEFRSMSEWEQYRTIVKCQRLIRKLAHVSEYAGLAFLTTLLVLQFSEMEKALLRAALLALAFCVVYAATDEVHQLFIDGRSASIVDILIDSGGAVIGAAIALCVHLIYIRIRKTR